LTAPWQELGRFRDKPEPPVKQRFLVKIIPPRGYTIYRFEFAWRHIAFLAGALALVVLGGVTVHFYQLWAADSAVAHLRSIADEQRAKLSAINAEAAAISGQLDAIMRRDQEIRRAIGLETSRQKDVRRNMRDDRESAVGRPRSFADVESRIGELAQASAEASADELRLEKVALRILNTRRLESIARDELLAAIPSLNPVNGAINSPFGYRTNPWPEFHPGVDLSADYGDPVRAAAAGTVVTAGWDAGYGIKVDIDHGNRYHTWYAHLSRVDVQPGQRVTKGQIIARVGATGEATGPHLHYQVMFDGNPVDPAPFLNGVPQKIMAGLQ
jgi:murein DD-endopeptidase MepM/ murein hydrolase activator NlpD